MDLVLCKFYHVMEYVALFLVVSNNPDMAKSHVGGVKGVGLVDRGCALVKMNRILSTNVCT